MGQCKVSGSSPRLYITCPNKDVEFSAEVFVENDCEIAHLIARSDHQIRPSGFGGYYLYCNFKDQKMYFKKEQTHELGYSPRLKEKDINFDKGKWHKMVIKVWNDENNEEVLIEGQFDDKIIYAEDKGDLKGEPYTDEGKWCFIRTNKPDGVKYRNVKVQIIP